MSTGRIAAELSLGEVVSWKAPTDVSVSRLKGALVSAGLDGALCRDMLPRNAFRRAIKDLDDSRVIKQVREDNDFVYFQFTKESRVGDKFDYDYETVLAVKKDTGDVLCDDGTPAPGLIAEAQRLVQDKLGTRTASDITRIVQRIFESKGDLFSIRESGGVYFVPEQHKGLVDQVENMLDQIGGYVRGFTVHPDGGRTVKSVKDSVRDGLQAIVAELNTAVDGFSIDTDDARGAVKTQRMFEKLQLAKLKITGYGELLEEYQETLKAAATEAERQLKIKLGMEVEPAETVEGAAVVTPAPAVVSKPAPVAAKPVKGNDDSDADIIPFDIDPELTYGGSDTAEVDEDELAALGLV